MTVTSDEIVGGVFNHLLSRKSGGDQVKERFDKLAKRYEVWWNDYGNRISIELNSVQNTLISNL